MNRRQGKKKELGIRKYFTFTMTGVFTEDVSEVIEKVDNYVHGQHSIVLGGITGKIQVHECRV